MRHVDNAFLVVYCVFILADVKSLYEKVTAPVIPSPPTTPLAKRSQAEIERDKRERQEEQMNRQALKKKEIPSYFESEMGRAFLISNSAGKYSARCTSSNLSCLP